MFDNLPAAIAALLRDPDAALADVPAGFQPIALSHLAEGCVDRAVLDPSTVPDARACVTTARKALPRSPHGSLAVAHALIVEEAAVYLGLGSNRDEALVTALVDETLDDSLKTAPSFVGSSSRWPADQAAAMYALWLYDNNHGTDRLGPVRTAHDAVMAERGVATNGLPVSELGHLAYGDLPRGCALSWTVRYQAAYDPDGAKALWEKYVKAYFVDLGPMGGFREWPPGVERAADVDSGPIVFGVGAAATAFGRIAAAVGDDVIAGKLARTASVGRAAVNADGEAARLANGTLPATIEWKTASAAAQWFPAR